MTEIRNLLHNPRPGMPGGAEFKAGQYATVAYSAGRITVTATQSFAYAQRDITLHAGDWVDLTNVAFGQCPPPQQKGNQIMDEIQVPAQLVIARLCDQISAQARQIAVLQAQIQTMQQSGGDSDA